GVSAGTRRTGRTRAALFGLARGIVNHVRAQRDGSQTSRQFFEPLEAAFSFQVDVAARRERPPDFFALARALVLVSLSHGGVLSKSALRTYHATSPPW